MCETGTDQYNGNVVVNNTGGGIRFGNNTGTAILAPGARIAVGSGGYATGLLLLKNFRQQGSTAQLLNLTGTAALYFRAGCTFDAPLTAVAGRIHLDGGTFNGPTDLTTTSGSTSTGAGGCIFNDVLQLTCAGAGEFQVCNSGSDLYNGDVLVNNTGAGIRFGDSNGNPTLASGRTLRIGSGGFATGLLLLRNFQQPGTTPQSFDLSGSARMYFRGNCQFDADLEVIAPSIHMDGGTYASNTRLVMTGNSNASGSGGCTFNGPLEITTTGTGHIYLSDANNDAYNGDITLNCTGDGGMVFGNNGGTGVLAAGRTISVGSGGFDSGYLLLRGFSQTGSTPQNLAFTGSAELYLRPGVEFNGPLVVNAPAIHLDGGTYNDVARFTMSGASASGGSGGCTFNAAVELNTTGAGQFDLYSTNNNTFNGDVVVTSAPGAGGVQIGSATGTSVLAAGRTIAIGAAGFASGTLDLMNFVQLGSTPQVLALSGSALLNILAGTTFNGSFTAVSPRLSFSGGTFNDAVRATMTGNNGVNSNGGNTFNSSVELTVTGGADMRMTVTNNDTFNGDITLNSIGGGGIRFGTGNSVGIGTLSATSNIAIGASGFDAGVLMFDNFQQLSTLPQSLVLTGSSSLYIYSGSLFNAELECSAPRVFLNGAVYNGNVSFTKTGASNDDSSGGNTFNGDLELSTTSGAAEMRMYTSNSDLYNGNIRANNVSGGGIRFGLSTSAGTGTLAAGRTIAVGSSGFDNGVLTFNNFSQTGNTPQVLTTTGNATLSFNTGSVFDGEMAATAPRLYLNGSTFQGNSSFVKSGPNADNSSGGNVFNARAEFTNTNTGELRLHNTGNDLFNGDVRVNCTGTGGIRFGLSGGTGTLAAGNTIGVGSAGYASGLLAFRFFTQLGSSTPNSLLCTGTAVLHLLDGNTFNAPLTTTSAGLFLSGTTFNSTLQATKTGATTDASVGNNVFNGTTDLIIVGNGAMLLNSTQPDLFNADLRLSCNGTGGFWFGNNGGSATLANGRTITVGSGGFTSGTLSLRNFVQQGNTPQNIAMATSGTGLLRIRTGSIFNGPLTTDTPGLLLDGGTFNGAVQCTKRGATNNNCRGGNTFNAAARVENASAGQLLLANTQPDVFNAAAELVRSGAGNMLVAYGANTTFMGDISLVGSTGIIQFGQNLGVTIIAGSGDRSFNGVAAFPPNVRHLRMNTSGGGKLLLNVTMDIYGATEFMAGEIHAASATSTGNGIVRFANTVTFPTPANAISFVDGFVRKTGNMAFTFPVGDNGRYAPISISAPANAAHHFTARYVNADADPLFDDASKDVSIDHISDCEYWLMDRTNGTSNVSVTLSWDTPRSCGVTVPADLLIARWNGTSWKDQGNTALTGNTTTGSLTTAAAQSSFNAFTLGSSFGTNPLPVELLYFDAEAGSNAVQCSWATASESGNDRFEVQRSPDGFAFTTVGTVQGVGNSFTTTNYSFTDNAPLQGTSYYRLKQVDLDGTATLSATVAVELLTMNALTLYPNPAVETVTVLRSDTENGAARTMVLDMRGRVVREAVIGAGAANSIVPVGDLPSGIYTLRVIGADGVVSEGRFLRQ